MGAPSLSLSILSYSAFSFQSKQNKATEQHAAENLFLPIATQISLPYLTRVTTITLARRTHESWVRSIIKFMREGEDGKHGNSSLRFATIL